MKKILLNLLLFVPTLLFAHPDDKVPYYYPSSFIYGYINGCYEATEFNQVPFTQDMWPDDVKNVCACVVDAMRHSMTYEEIIDNSSHMTAVLIAQATLPICIREEMAKK